MLDKIATAPAATVWTARAKVCCSDWEPVIVSSLAKIA